MRSNKNSKKRKTNQYKVFTPRIKRRQRLYYNCKNFLEHKCISVDHDLEKYWQQSNCPEKYWEENVVDDVESWTTGRWSWHAANFYFEKEIDVVIFRLRYPS